MGLITSPWKMLNNFPFLWVAIIAYQYPLWRRQYIIVYQSSAKAVNDFIAHSAKFQGEAIHIFSYHFSYLLPESEFDIIKVNLEVIALDGNDRKNKNSSY